MDSTNMASRRSRTGLLAVAGAVAFTATWITLSFVSDGYTMWDITVTSYSSIAQPISGLGLGSTAPYMNTAFTGCGILVAFGTWAAVRTWPNPDTKAHTWVRRTVPFSGVGMAVCGTFDLESIMVHTLGFVLAAGVSGIGFIVAGRYLRTTSHRLLSAWLRFAGPAGLVGMIAFMATFNGEDAGDNVGYAGLVERVLVTVLMISVAGIGLSTEPTATQTPVPTSHSSADPACPPDVDPITPAAAHSSATSSLAEPD